MASCEEIAEKFVFEDLISDVSWPLTLPSDLVTTARLWIERLMLRWRCASSLVNVCVSRFSGAKRLNTPRRSRTALGLGAAPFAPGFWNAPAPPESSSSR